MHIGRYSFLIPDYGLPFTHHNYVKGNAKDSIAFSCIVS